MMMLPPRGAAAAPARAALAGACLLLCATTQLSTAYSAARATDCAPGERCLRPFAPLSNPQHSSQEVTELHDSRCGSNDTISNVDCSPPSASTPATAFMTSTTRASANASAATPPNVPLVTPTLALVNGTNCATPDGQIGRCINLYDCPYLVQLLVPPVLQENELFVRNSKCESADSLSVCCTESPPSTKKPFIKPKICEPGAAPPDPRSGCCGRPSDDNERISMGEDTGIYDYPWMALIEYQGKFLKLLCGGALISGRYVLTAAHCIVGDDVLNAGTPTNVRLGEYNTGNEISERDCVRTAGGGWDCTDPPIVIPIEQFIVHEGYRPWDPNKRNDIALLRLKYTAPYTYFIRPICLPSTDVTQDPPEDIALYAAGWGALNITTVHSDIKQHTSLPFTNFTECQSIYLRKYKHVELWNKQLCVGGRDGRDTCRKDSGGPLMYENGRVYEVVGVVSFGPSTCGGAAVAPGVYTKVHEYNAWIRSHIRP